MPLRSSIVVFIVMAAMATCAAADSKSDKAWRPEAELPKALADSVRFGRPVAAMYYLPNSTCPIHARDVATVRGFSSLSGCERVEINASPIEGAELDKLFKIAAVNHELSFPVVVLMKGDGSVVQVIRPDSGDKKLQEAISSLGPLPDKQTMTKLWADLERARALFQEEKDGNVEKALKLYAPLMKLRTANPSLGLVTEFEKDIPAIEASGTLAITAAQELVDAGKLQEGTKSYNQVKRLYQGFEAGRTAEEALKKK
jgi:hypothetical protein